MKTTTHSILDAAEGALDFMEARRGVQASFLACDDQKFAELSKALIDDPEQHYRFTGIKLSRFRDMPAGLKGLYVHPFFVA